jgi:hypothetical protein
MALDQERKRFFLKKEAKTFIRSRNVVVGGAAAYGFVLISVVHVVAAAQLTLD